MILVNLTVKTMNWVNLQCFAHPWLNLKVQMGLVILAVQATVPAEHGHKGLAVADGRQLKLAIVEPLN